MPIQNRISFRILTACWLLGFGTIQAQEYPFQNPDLPVEERIENIISLLTLDEKVACLSTNPSVPRLGIKGSGHVEGLHGLAKGGPSNWGQRDPVPTTIFPQAIGLAESWDPEVLKRVAAIEAQEVRYIFQSPKYQKGGLVVRAPNAGHWPGSALGSHRGVFRRRRLVQWRNDGGFHQRLARRSPQILEDRLAHEAFSREQQ